MSKIVKFRIIELKDYQVLLTKDFQDLEGEDESCPSLTLTVFLYEAKFTLSMIFDTEENRDQAFIDFTNKSAQDMINSQLANLN